MNQSFYVGALGAANCTEKLNVISSNLANINNYGFKPKTTAFSELISYNLSDTEGAVTELQAGAGVKVDRTYTSFDSATIAQTGNPYDYAIVEPNAFFMIQNPETGAVTYTRDGHFHRGMGEDGYYLMTAKGGMVLDQNKEPIRLEVLDIEKMKEKMEEGYEEEAVEEETEDENKPEVSLYTFKNPSRLISVGDNEFIHPEAEAVLVENPSLVNEGLETSGTDITKELARMIECQRAFSYALKMVTTSDEIQGTVNTLRG